MQKRNLYIWGMTLIAAVASFLSSCTEEIDVVPAKSSSIQVIGRVPAFDDYEVTTRGIKNSAESDINYMALLTFDDAGDLIDVQQLQSSTPLFVIDRNDLQGKAEAKGHTVRAASMYLVANISQGDAADWSIETVNGLKDLVYKTSTTSLEIPANGFPMVGIKKNIDLRPSATITESKIEIELENLYAKIVFTIEVDPTQEFYTPSFQLQNWEVHNLPRGVKMAENLRNDGQSAFYNDTIAHYISSRRGAGTTSRGANPLTFTFYMPEHMINPAQDTTQYSYPEGNLTHLEKQRFKPCLVEKAINPAIPDSYDSSPAYIVINGIYTDHQNFSHAISYKLYLGADSYSNFQIVRNGQYNNSVVIRGVTKSTDGTSGTISLDHRVNVARSDFITFMERETMLDAHIEVRPVQITIPQKDGVSQSVKCYLSALPAAGASPIPISKDDNNYKWVRMEPVAGAMNTGEYCEYTNANTANKGRRKYFTVGLLDELNRQTGNGISTTFTNENNTLWLYFDENTSVSKDGFREVMLVVEYYEGAAKLSERQYVFRQHDLFPVIFYNEGDRTYYRYDIEYYEEYLYNFNANDDYDETRAGMPWGPTDMISNQILAIQDVQSGWTDNLTYIEDAIKEAGGNYDFQDNFWGRFYTLKLVNKMGQTVLTQDKMAESAAQHCHNKNKRNDDGTVNTLQWYQPAIGELQHIMSAAYTDFDMFQNNRYWSSQTSYRIGHFKYNLLWGFLGSVEGDFFYEDNATARATKAEYKGGDNYSYEPSEATGTSKTWNGSVTNQTGSWSESPQNHNPDSGNQPRTEEFRVRAVYKKYTGSTESGPWTEITTEAGTEEYIKVYQ